MNTLRVSASSLALLLAAAGCGAESDGPIGASKEALGTQPGARAFAAMGYHAGTQGAVLFGGEAGGGWLSDTWVWDGSAWGFANPAGAIPLARAGHVMGSDPAGGALLFGGRDGSELFGDTWLWNGSAWLPQPSTTSPSPRAGASVAFHPGLGGVVLFGGEAGGRRLSDTWVWDGPVWNDMTDPGAPPARSYAAMAYHGASAKLVLFGGTNGVQYFSDTWTYNGTWQPVTGSAATPPPRAGAALVEDASGKLVLYGGGALASTLQDAWTFDGASWTREAVDAPPRAYMASTYHAGSGAPVVFGGRDDEGASREETFTWGGEDWGELEIRVTPEVGAGQIHSCSLTYEGDIFCWGGNRKHQLAKDTGGESQPIPALTLQGARNVIGGQAHSCAIRRDGVPLCWGGNGHGELGCGSQPGCGPLVTTPTPVPGLPNVKQLSGGGSHTCAVTRDGDLYCWGRNLEGQLGIGSFTSQSSPAKVSLSDVKLVAAGSLHTCALTHAGAVSCWGNNAYGQLGHSSKTASKPNGNIVGLPAIVDLAVGDTHGCAVTGSGEVWCWGSNASGQLGQSGVVSSTTPVRASLPASAGPAVRLALGAKHSCAITQDTSIWCWGSDDRGQLGNGDPMAASSAPVRVVVGLAAPLTGAMSIGSGHFHTCVLQEGGAHYCWGANGFGQLGDGYASNSTAPGYGRAFAAPAFFSSDR